MPKEMDFDSVARGGEAPSEWSQQPFSVIIAYDTPESARRAVRLVDGLVAEFGEFDVHCDLWRFDILGLPGLRETALGNAALASLVVVAASGDTDLPMTVRSWLERWSAGGIPGTAALVAVLERRPTPGPGPSRAHRFLEALAKRAGQDFFAREFVALPSSLGPPLEQEMEQRATQTSSILLGILARSHPPPRWGLNE